MIVIKFDTNSNNFHLIVVVGSKQCIKQFIYKNILICNNAFDNIKKYRHQISYITILKS